MQGVLSGPWSMGDLGAQFRGTSKSPRPFLGRLNSCRKEVNRPILYLDEGSRGKSNFGEGVPLDTEG